MDCIFCKIIDKKIPCHLIKETENAIAFLDSFPKGYGHTLVLPKKHYQFFHEIPIDILNEMNQLVSEISAKLYRQTKSSYNVISNNGEEAGQSVFHCHIHILPRQKDDNAIIFSHGEDKSSKYNLAEIAKQIRENL